MPSFVYESLLWWGLPLVGLPVLIHLINLMRHRRVKWAAMEFLLQQYQESICAELLITEIKDSLDLTRRIVFVGPVMSLEVVGDRPSKASLPRRLST